MILLDENITEDQRVLLRSWRLRVSQIGREVERKGIDDDAIIPLLRQLPHPTWFTRDMGFYDRRLAHPGYCLVCLHVEEHDVASFARRFLHHHSFDTQKKRMGWVVHAGHTEIRGWRLHSTIEETTRWD